MRATRSDEVLKLQCGDKQRRLDSSRLLQALVLVFLSIFFITSDAGLLQSVTKQHEIGNGKNDAVEMCFVTSQFGTNVQNADQIISPAESAPSLHQDPHVHFFLFTNMKALEAPEGWKVLLREYSQYQRTITQSRVPKFLGFQDHTIQSNCDVVFYFDGSSEINGDLNDFQLEAQKLLNRESVGLTQYKHPCGGSIDDELFRIQRYKKDSEENVAITKSWIHAQPDFHPNITVYMNSFIGYDVKSSTFQKAAKYFWSLYSEEIGSWRDQPYWAYALHHLNVVPMYFSNSSIPLFSRTESRAGMDGHRYVDFAKGNTTKATNRTEGLNNS